MRKLKVLKMYECSLVRYDDKSHRLLKACEPYVTWGAPDVRTIRELITKRGHALKKVLFCNPRMIHLKTIQGQESGTQFERSSGGGFW